MSSEELKPEIKEGQPKPETTAREPDPKAVQLTRDPDADTSKPAAKAENKTAIEPDARLAPTAGNKPKVELEETKLEAKAAAPRTALGNKIIFSIAIIGILDGLFAAYMFGLQRKAQPPVFKPVSNPFESAIYANGMGESDLPSGENINIFPQVSGPITRVLVQEGQSVQAGTLLFTIEDSVQSANVELAAANLKLARDQYDKDRGAYDLDPKSISKTLLDTAEDTVTQTTAALKAAKALLRYFSAKAPVDGVVLAVNATVGGYVSSQGDFDTYTELFDPLMVMSGPQDYMDVRCYIDEILVSRLPSKWHIQAQMQITGTDIKVPLDFVRVQPYISP